MSGAESESVGQEYPGGLAVGQRIDVVERVELGGGGVAEYFVYGEIVAIGGEGFVLALPKDKGEVTYGFGDVGLGEQDGGAALNTYVRPHDPDARMREQTRIDREARSRFFDDRWV